MKNLIIKELKSQLEALKFAARIIRDFIRIILLGIVTLAFVFYLPMCIVWRYSGDCIDSSLDWGMFIGLIVLFGWISNFCFNIYMRYKSLSENGVDK